MDRKDPLEKLDLTDPGVRAVMSELQVHRVHWAQQEMQVPLDHLGMQVQLEKLEKTAERAHQDKEGQVGLEVDLDCLEILECLVYLELKERVEIAVLQEQQVQPELVELGEQQEPLVHKDPEELLVQGESRGQVEMTVALGDLG